MINKLFLLLLPLIISLNFAASSSIQKENFSKIYQLDQEAQHQLDTIKYYIKHAKYCQLVGKSNQAILDIHPKAVIRSGSKNNVKLFILTDNETKHQTLVIRGSSNFKNWISNAKFWKTKDNWARGAKVHKGFYQVAREIYKLSHPLLNPAYSTTITGHSLGGAAGTLISLYLQRVSFKNIKVVSFGAPRLTNSNGARLLNDIHLHRVAHEDDIVTKLPPKFLSYRHFGQLFKLSKNKILRNDEVEDDSEDSQEVLDTWKKLENNEIDIQVNIPSHFIKNYIKRLYSLLHK
ncbi:MAG: lipase family protein [Candidatus Cloacimonetes bacterium]|nr:lipase family protein [Candidatus Cloacimonadota bacterium]